jgi:hypothetical protein
MMVKRVGFMAAAVFTMVACWSMAAFDPGVFTEPALLALFGLGLTWAGPLLRRKTAHPAAAGSLFRVRNPGGGGDDLPSSDAQSYDPAGAVRC